MMQKPTTNHNRRSLWRIGEILIQKEWIDWAQLAVALKAQSIQKDLLGEILIDRHNIERKHVIRALAIQCGIPFIELKEYLIEKAAVDLVPRRFVEQYHFMPLEKGGKSILIAVSNPFNHFIRALLCEELGIKDVQIAAAMPEDIEESIRKFYQSDYSRAA